MATKTSAKDTTKASAKSTTTKTSTRKSSTKKSEKVATEQVVAPIVEPAPEAAPVVEQETVEVEKPSAPQVQTVVYKNADDERMTIIHLYTQRTPIFYGNGKKKVFNKYGEKWTLTVREFEQEFAPSPVADALLKQKVLAVGADCPDEVRERLEIDYTEKQLITADRYKALLTLGTEEVCELFEELCMEHKLLMPRLFADDFEQGGKNCQRDKIKALNDISKKYVADGETGMFAALLSAVTDKERKDY